MSFLRHGVPSLRSAFFVLALTAAFAATASARVPDECRQAPVSVRCAKALWHAAHAKPRPAAAATNAPEGSDEDSHRDYRTPLHPAPYGGPPAGVPAHPVKTPPLKKMKMIPPPKRGEHTEHREPARPAPPTDTPRVDDTPHQHVMGPVRSAPAASGTSFDGIGAGLPGFSVVANPPDVNGRVGATQYVQWNNLSFAVWDKSGKLLYGPAAGNTLFQPLGGVCASHNDGDPVVSYDILAGRWVLSQFVVYGSPAFSHQCVAVSLTDDATGSYYLYDFVTDASNFVDYPHMGVWPDGYYMASNVFDGSGSYLVAARVTVFERDKMLKGQTARQLSADLKQYGGLPQYGFLVADVDSALPPPAGEAEFVLGPDPSTTSLFDSARVAVTWGATPSIALTETTIPVPWTLAPCLNGGRACVPQPPPASTGAYLDSLDQHIMHRLAYRNFGGSPVQESLVANITVTGSASTPAHGAIRWFELRNAGSSATAPAVYQSATFDPDTEYRWMGSIAMDKDHDIALGYSRSSTSTKPSIYVNGRLGTDPLNTLGAETVMQAGGGVQTGGGNRWGDYSAMSLDPVDQCTFWYTNEYFPVSSSYNWATRIASFKFPSCTGVVWGTVSGTVTSCANGTAVDGVVVALDNGYNGATDATGHYSILVPAGTYTASVSAADRNCTSSSPATVSVVVPSNGTVSQNFCVGGSSKLELASVAVDDHPNGNGNGVVNRNECIDVAVTIANNGCGDETGISGTLSTTTPGVTITRASSFYPDLAVGASGASTLPFRIQTAPAFVCGTTIALTLNLAAAGGNQSVAFTLPTCGAGSQTIPATSLSPADPGQSARIFRDGNVSDCGATKACAGAITGGTFNYKTFPFSNPSSSPACVTVTINGACGAAEIESGAYSGSTYTPRDSSTICNQLLGDGGSSVTSGALSYSFTAPAQSSFVVVVETVDPSSTCTSFSGTVTGIIDDTAGPGACPACTPPATPTISAGGPTTFCSGGSVTLTSSATSGNQWFRNGTAIGGATAATYAAATSGSYTVVTTSNNCPSAPSAATAVTVNTTPATPTAANGGPYCVGATISLSTPTVAGATYAWTGPNGFTSALQNPTRANAAAADAGAYSVVVTVSGCPSAAGSTSVSVAPVPATPTAANGGPYCAGATISLSTPTVAGATYAWTGPNGFTSALQNPTRANAALADAGTYSVSVIVNGCPSAPATTSVVVNATPPTPSALNTGPYCEGATIALSTPTVANATYSWTGPNGFTSALQNPSIANATPAHSGTYSVTVTVNACTSPAGGTIVNVAPVPATPTAANGGPFCEGGTISLSTPAVAGATYSWTGPNGFTSAQQNPTRPNAAPADAGTYSVTVTVNGCTSAAGSTTVALTPRPAQPTATNGGPYCEGSTITLSTPAVSGATYAWTGPNGFTSTLQSPTRAGAATADFGTYSVVVTVNGCPSSAGTTQVADLTPATPTATNGGPYCAGGTIALSTPTVAGAAYAWTGPNGFTSALQNPTIANAAAANGGAYSVTVTANGCTSSAGTTTVAVNAMPATPAASNTGPYCAGQTIALSTPTVAGVTYSWTGPNGFTSSQQNPTVANATAAMGGTYSVTLFNGCTTAAGSTTVVVKPTPATPTATNGGPYCAGGTIALSTPTVAGATYSWTGPNGFTSPQQNPTLTSATAAMAGAYSVVVTVNGCPSAAGATSVAVNALPATPTASNGGPYCAGGTIALSTPTVANATYAWTGPNGFTSSQQNPTLTSATAAMAGGYSVTVTVNGCPSAAGSTSVTIKAVPATPAASNSGPACLGGQFTLSTPSVANATYAWTGPNGFTSTLQNPSLSGATAAMAGAYSVTVTVNGCPSAPGSTTVAVNPTPPTPTISAGGPTTFCAGGSVVLTSSSPSNNQWRLNGAPISGATGTTYTATSTGAYTVGATPTGCQTASSVATNVTATPPPNASILVGVTIPPNFSSPATVADAGAGAAYVWSVSNGTITAGQGTRSITFTTGALGSTTVTVKVTDGGGCTATQSSVASISALARTLTPSIGRTTGGTTVSIGGAGFQNGIAVVFGGVAATNVVRVSDTAITATAPPHAAGTVNVNVLNPDGGGTTMVSAFTYAAQQFDPNNDHAIDPADIFYLINYLFSGGPPPSGAFGMMSGDANGDNVVDPADIFYLINYIFTSGPAPLSLPPRTLSTFSGSITLGAPVLRGGRTFVPVIVRGHPHALSLRVRGTGVVAIRRTTATQPVFENAPPAAYLASFGANAVDGVVAEIEVTTDGHDLELDPALTMLTDQSGAQKATRIERRRE